MCGQPLAPAGEPGHSAAKDASMLGAIAGDVIGSVHEGARTKTKDFPLFVAESTFTDDSVLTVAVAECLLHGGSYIDALHKYYHSYHTQAMAAPSCVGQPFANGNRI